MNEIDHFEVIVHTDSKLPPNYMVDYNGKLYYLDNNFEPPVWKEKLFGGKNVYIKKADLGVKGTFGRSLI
jgi:hypothetical protein